MQLLHKMMPCKQITSKIKLICSKPEMAFQCWWYLLPLAFCQFALTVGAGGKERVESRIHSTPPPYPPLLLRNFQWPSSGWVWIFPGSAQYQLRKLINEYRQAVFEDTYIWYQGTSDESRGISLISEIYINSRGIQPPSSPHPYRCRGSMSLQGKRNVTYTYTIQDTIIHVLQDGENDQTYPYECPTSTFLFLW